MNNENTEDELVFESPLEEDVNSSFKCDSFFKEKF